LWSIFIAIANSESAFYYYFASFFDVIISVINNMTSNIRRDGGDNNNDTDNLFKFNNLAASFGGVQNYNNNNNNSNNNNNNKSGHGSLQFIEATTGVLPSSDIISNNVSINAQNDFEFFMPLHHLQPPLQQQQQRQAIDVPVRDNSGTMVELQSGHSQLMPNLAGLDTTITTTSAVASSNDLSDFIINDNDNNSNNSNNNNGQQAQMIMRLLQQQQQQQQGYSLGMVGAEGLLAAMTEATENSNSTNAQFATNSILNGSVHQQNTTLSQNNINFFPIQLQQQQQPLQDLVSGGIEQFQALTSVPKALAGLSASSALDQQGNASIPWHNPFGTNTLQLQNQLVTLQQQQQVLGVQQQNQFQQQQPNVVTFQQSNDSNSFVKLQNQINPQILQQQHMLQQASVQNQSHLILQQQQQQQQPPLGLTTNNTASIPFQPSIFGQNVSDAALVNFGSNRSMPVGTTNMPRQVSNTFGGPRDQLVTIQNGRPIMQQQQLLLLQQQQQFQPSQSQQNMSLQGQGPAIGSLPSIMMDDDISSHDVAAAAGGKRRRNLVASSGRSKRKKTFPEKLMQALIDYGNDETVAWLPDGKSFVVVNPDFFCSAVLSKAFKEAKYASFVRKLHRWGFVRLTSGTGTDCFHHPQFQRNGKDLVSAILCVPRGGDEKNSTDTICATITRPIDTKPPSLSGVEKFIKGSVVTTSLGDEQL
jgi:hypothetical protein